MGSQLQRIRHRLSAEESNTLRQLKLAASHNEFAAQQLMAHLVRVAQLPESSTGFVLSDDFQFLEGWAAASKDAEV